MLVCTVTYSAVNLRHNLSPVKYYKWILNWCQCLLLVFVTDQLEFVLKSADSVVLGPKGRACLSHRTAHWELQSWWTSGVTEAWLEEEERG